MLSCKKPPDHQSYGHQRDDHQNRLYQEFGGLESKIEQNKRTDADADATGGVIVKVATRNMFSLDWMFESAGN